MTDVLHIVYAKVGLLTSSVVVDSGIYLAEIEGNFKAFSI